MKNKKVKPSKGVSNRKRGKLHQCGGGYLSLIQQSIKEISNPVTLVRTKGVSQHLVSCLTLLRQHLTATPLAGQSVLRQTDAYFLFVASRNVYCKN